MKSSAIEGDVSNDLSYTDITARATTSKPELYYDSPVLQPYRRISTNSESVDLQQEDTPGPSKIESIEIKESLLKDYDTCSQEYLKPSKSSSAHI